MGSSVWADACRMTDLYGVTAGDNIEVRNPADGTVVGEVPVDSAETVAAKARELRLANLNGRPWAPRAASPGC